MKLDIRAAALTAGVIWGLLAMFATGLVNLVWPDYGAAFLGAAASLYPGYEAGRSLGQVIIGALYGFADGAILGALTAWLYNRLATGETATEGSAAE